MALSRGGSFVCVAGAAAVLHSTDGLQLYRVHANELMA
jgi:uncharacterized membrane protein